MTMVADSTRDAHAGVDWSRALCRGTDPSLFFPETDADAMFTRTVCAACPIRPECRAYGRRHETDGVWGGLLLIEGRARDLWDIDTVWVRSQGRRFRCCLCGEHINIGTDHRLDRASGERYCVRCTG